MLPTNESSSGTRACLTAKISKDAFKIEIRPSITDPMKLLGMISERNPTLLGNTVCVKHYSNPTNQSQKAIPKRKETRRVNKN